MFLPKKNQRYPALLFSDSDLKIAKLDQQGTRLKLFFESPLPAGIIKEGEIKNPVELARFLAKIKAKTGLKDKFVIVGLSEQKASTHSLTLPDLLPQEIDSAIKFQADSFLPFPYQDEYLDWMLIEKMTEAKIKILISAVPKKIVDGFAIACQKAGFNPLAFETTSLSLLRLLPPEGRKLSFAAEIGQKAVVLILGLKGNIEACSVIQKPSEFLQTLEKMADFYFPYESKKDKPKVIYLCGLAANQGLLANIKKNLALNPVLLASGISNVPANRQTELAVLLSLAKKEVKLPEDTKTINILPAALINKYSSVWSQKRQKLICLALAITLIFLDALVFFSCLKLAGQNRLLANVADTSKTGQQADSLANLTVKAKILNDFSARQKNDLVMIKKITGLGSPQTEILGLNLDHSASEIEIHGRAKTRADLLELKQKLEDEKFFDKVSVPFSALEKETEIEFRITAGIH